MEKMHTLTKYWLVVHSWDTGDVKNASIVSERVDDLEKISSKFEKEHPSYKVIHIGEGELPPESYRSLSYL